jgi:lycopene beta-cyclase
VSGGPGAQLDVDVAIVGAGGAGLSLVVELDRLSAGTGRPAPSVALVDPVTRSGDDRTWCFWDTGPGDLEPAVVHSWNRASVVDRAGRTHLLDLAPLRYVMVGSAGFYALAEQSARRIGAVRVAAPALAVTDGSDRAEVVTEAATVRARWVFDSRPAPPQRAPRTTWLQHFRGWSLRFDRPPGDGLDPDLAVLMDFSVVQPGELVPGSGPGLAFGYLLPTATDRALIEYTVFSPARLPDAAYDDALRRCLSARWPDLAPGRGIEVGAVEVEAVEDGAIPLTDAVHARRAGSRVFRVGTAGGATRGSTGYTFAAIQRQARAIAEALVTGSTPGLPAAVPVPPRGYPGRHRWMDAVLLRALDRGLVDGPDLFVRLFTRNPPERVLRFLDGATSWPQDLAVMASAPQRTMTRAAVGDAVTRVRRRLGPRA